MAGVKMGCARSSVAVAALVMMVMMFGTSHCLMSNMSSSAAITAGNSTAASSAWCDGHMIDGQCLLIAHSYGGGEHLEYLNVDVMDMMVEGQSSRRVLEAGGKNRRTLKAIMPGKPTAGGKTGRYGPQPPRKVDGRCSTYNRFKPCK